MRLQVVRRAFVERPSLVLAELRAQVAGKQVVVAVPATLGIERDKEQVGELGACQQRVSIVAAAERPGQPSVEALGDRGLDEEAPQVVVDALEDLVGEIVEDEALAATESLDERGGIRRVPERVAASWRPAIRPSVCSTSRATRSVATTRPASARYADASSTA